MSSIQSILFEWLAFITLLATLSQSMASDPPDFSMHSPPFDPLDPPDPDTTAPSTPTSPLLTTTSIGTTTPTMTSEKDTTMTSSEPSLGTLRSVFTNPPPSLIAVTVRTSPRSLTTSTQVSTPPPLTFMTTKRRTSSPIVTPATTTGLPRNPPESVLPFTSTPQIDVITGSTTDSEVSSDLPITTKGLSTTPSAPTSSSQGSVSAREERRDNEFPSDKVTFSGLASDDIFDYNTTTLSMDTTDHEVKAGTSDDPKFVPNIYATTSKVITLTANETLLNVTSGLASRGVFYEILLADFALVLLLTMPF